MEENLEQKQTFLRQQIVEKGYDPEKFLEYVKSLKEGGEDVSSWTMEQLKEVVYEYRKQFDRSSKEGVKLEAEEAVAPNINRKECKKYQRFLDKDLSNIQVVVQKPEIVTLGGFLGFGATSVLSYAIRTSVVQNQVRREDGDFDWLRSTLIRFHPNRIIPPLAKSKPILPDDTKALFKRSQMIRLFIEGLSKCEPLMNCKLTVAFLTWGDYPRFEAFKKQQNFQMSPLTPSDFITQSGKVEIEISKQNSKLIKNMGIYNSSLKSTYQQIRETLKDVDKNFEDLTASIYRVGNSFATLQEKHSDLMTNVPEFKDEVFNEIMIGLNNCVIEWGRTFNSRRKAVEKHLSTMFKFTMQESQIFEKVLKKRAIIEEEYTKLRMQLHKKKERLTATNPVLNKIQIPFSINQKIKIGSIPKEDFYQLIPISDFKTQNDLRETLGSYNSACKSQFLRLQPIIKNRLLQGFKSMGKAVLQSNKSQTEVVMRLINGQY